MTNNAKVGGVLSIIAGAFGVLGLLIFILLAVVMVIMPGEFDGYYYDSNTSEGIFTIIAAVYLVMGLFSAFFGVLAIVGGVFALRKKHWGWALVGAIAGALTFFLCGVPAVIFIAMGKPEFQKTAPVAPAPTAPTIG